VRGAAGPGFNCLTIFADSIAEANIYGRDKWAVAYERDKVRLIVGHIITCTLGNNRIWMALDSRLLEASSQPLVLEQSDDWEWDTNRYPEYPTISSRNGYYRPSKNHEKIWPAIRRPLFESIYRAANETTMDPRTPQGHSPEVLRYLRNELGRHVPDPLY
jgi:hypothetical protein